MIKRKRIFVLGLAGILAFFSLPLMAQQGNSKTKTTSSVKVAGAMRKVMMKGELQGTIALDTIADKQHLYGLGPVEYLSGELLVMDGKIYQSNVVSNKAMRVKEVKQVKAPFFVYGNVPEWKEQALPDSIQSIKQLESYLDKISQTSQRPFAFRLKGDVESATIHIVNLPAGTKVSSPEHAHKGQQNYTLTDKKVEIVGFFSTEHKSVFTHHDTFLHMHLITSDKKQMGHLDAVTLKKGSVKLYLPKYLNFNTDICTSKEFKNLIFRSE